MFELILVRSFKSGIYGDARRPISVVFLINGSTFVAMQPRSVAANRDEIAERKFIVIKVGTSANSLSIRHASLHDAL